MVSCAPVVNRRSERVANPPQVSNLPYNPHGNAVQAQAAARQSSHVLGEQSHQKQRVIPDVVPDLALAIERMRAVRFDHHLADLLQPSAARVADPVKRIDVGEVGQHVRDVRSYFMFSAKFLFDKAAEKTAERTSHSASFS
jgi:hypothetical protein